MGFTENHSPTFLSSGNPCVDFFFHVVPDTPPKTLTQRLQLAWAHNPLTALKLVCNLRGVRGTGKSDKEGFYAAALWLHKNHPKTLACNVASVADFGYFKDLPEILYRLLEGFNVREIQKTERLSREEEFSGRLSPSSRSRGIFKNHQKHRKHSPQKNLGRKSNSKEVKLLNDKLKSLSLRNNKRIAMAKKVVERIKRDSDYRFFYDRVSDLFSEHLKSDIQNLNSGEKNKISLAAKWCPSIDSSFDRSTLLCESIARRMFPKESPQYQGIEEAHYAYRIRDRLRKEILVPLRKILELPEVYMCANQWGALPYNRVASVAMKTYKSLFKKHDEDRFTGYLDKVKSGEAKIAAGALLPHEIIVALDDEDGEEVAELQWQRMVEDLAKKGSLKNCMAICDVSGSMSGTPLVVSVALGLLVSELSEEPWKGKLITFSARPELHMVEGSDLRSKIDFVTDMQWDMNTDFQKVFDLILQVAVNGNLSPEQMIKRLFVFSDMEFDQASTNNWETDYQVIIRKFTERGYGSAIPDIVFWNLRDSKATPVPSTQNGVALVSGFSKNLMKLFLEDSGALNPEAIMEAAISGEEYKKLVVVD